jgi:hypothetical protein
LHVAQRLRIELAQDPRRRPVDLHGLLDPHAAIVDMQAGERPDLATSEDGGVHPVHARDEAWRAVLTRRQPDPSAVDLEDGCARGRVPDRDRIGSVKRQDQELPLGGHRPRRTVRGGHLQNSVSRPPLVSRLAVSSHEPARRARRHPHPVAVDQPGASTHRRADRCPQADVVYGRQGVRQRIA